MTETEKDLIYFGLLFCIGWVILFATLLYDLSYKDDYRSIYTYRVRSLDYWSYQERTDVTTFSTKWHFLDENYHPKSLKGNLLRVVIFKNGEFYWEKDYYENDNPYENCHFKSSTELKVE